MGAPRIGTRVLEGTRAGVVVDHRPQGMVDVCFEDSGFVERRPANLLLAMNPAAKRAGLPAVRGKAALAKTRDVYDPAEEQRRAVVRGIYESLVAKRLGMSLAQYKALRDIGMHPDLAAAKRGIITQREFRDFVDKAERLSIGVGRKQGYVSYEGKEPTPAGAALAYARYGADPTVVQQMAKGHARAMKLAKEKKASALAKNRKLYEIMLMLARKDQTPRVVEEVVGGKLVSLQQPGAKRVARRRNVVSWEERGMARGMASFSAKMRPFLEEARHLGKQKGQALRQFAQVRKPSAKESLLRALADVDASFQSMTAKAVDVLGVDALDERGLVRPEVRRDLGVLRKTYEDTAADVQAGRLVKNPVNPRTKGIGIEGVGYHWAGVRTSKKSEFTPVTLSATPPALDVPDGKGFFLITFDPKRKDVERVLREVGGWRVVPQITGTKYETGLVKDAPKLHRVVQYVRGGSSGRGVGGQFSKGYYGVQGPKAKPTDVFERKDDALEYAKVLDQRAASFLLPETHEVWKVAGGFEVRGPRAEEESAKREAENAERSKKGEPPKWTPNQVALLFSEEEQARGMAAVLDRREAMRGALPIKGYRTAPGLSGEKAAKKYTETLAALEDNKVRYVLDRSLKQMEAPSTGTKRFTREEGGLVVLPETGTSARQRKLAERTPERLVETLLARGEDPERLIELVAEAEERGRKKLVNLLAKSYEEDATEVAWKKAADKLGNVAALTLLKSEREKTKIRAKMPGAFVQKMRKFGPEFKRGFEKEASDLAVLLAALYPKGDVPPTMLPKYERAQLLDMDDDDLDKLAKKKLGLSDKEIEKIRTSVERTVLSRVVAERAPATGVELVGRGGFEVEMTPKQRRALEEKRIGRAPGAKPVPRPLRPEKLAEKTPAPKVSEMSLAEIEAQIAALEAEIKKAERRRKNGLFSTGLRAARSGSKLAVEYGSKAYAATRAWLSTAAGQKFTAEVAGLAVSLFGAAAVSRGKLTPEQAEIVRREFERKTGQRVDSQTVRAAIQSQGV